MRMKILFIVSTLFSLLVGCGRSPEDARKELGQMGIKYDEVTFLERAAAGDLIAVRLFVESGMNVNTIVDVNPGGRVIEYAALHMAAGKGHLEVVKYLLDNGAIVDVKGDDGITPLLMAVQNSNNSQVVKLLLDKGANVNIEFKGRTAYLIAHERGNKEMEDLIIEKGGGKIEKTKDSIRADLINLASIAQQYYRKPKALGGGEGSFIGWQIPAKLEKTEYSTYSANVQPQEITLYGSCSFMDMGIDAKVFPNTFYFIQY